MKLKIFYHNNDDSFLHIKVKHKGFGSKEKHSRTVWWKIVITSTIWGERLVGQTNQCETSNPNYPRKYSRAGRVDLVSYCSFITMFNLVGTLDVLFPCFLVYCLCLFYVYASLPYYFPSFFR